MPSSNSSVVDMALSVEYAYEGKKLCWLSARSPIDTEVKYNDAVKLCDELAER